MTLYAYIKAPPGHTLKRRRSPLSIFKLIFSFIFIVTGIASITSVAYPLISYQLTYAPAFNRARILSPSTPEPIQSAPNPETLNTTFDYTDTSAWFAQSDSPTSSIPTRNSIYKLSIPKLGIKNAIVRSDLTDLKQSLIHYQGTSLPGELGNPVILGHSVLPQYFSPTNYISIFSTLYTLKVGDEIYLDFDGVEYLYVIDDMYEVIPTNTTPLEQSFDNRYLTVITCTPPGTYLRRLIVKAILI